MSKPIDDGGPARVDRPELRSSCCNAPVWIAGYFKYQHPSGDARLGTDYRCCECLTTCSTRNPDKEEFER